MANLISPESVRAIIKARRLRSKYLGDLFADPAWDIMLDLFANELEKKLVSVSSLTLAANVPQTTALRCIERLTDAGFLVREPDENDGRRFYVRLSEETHTNIGLYLFEAAATYLDEFGAHTSN